jgi:rubredoxin
MTGVAAQLCGDRKVVESLGYKVDRKGIVYDGDKAISHLGARKVVLKDLSPAATFIACNYNTPIEANSFNREVKRILSAVEKECGWMYETWHPSSCDDTKIVGRINYTIWSDVFRCPNCSMEMTFWDVAIEPKTRTIHDSWECIKCGSSLAKSPQKGSEVLRVERVMDTIYDRVLGVTIKQARQVPVLINYSIGKKRYEKKPDEIDLALIKKLEDEDIPFPFPIYELPKGFNTGQPKESHGFTNVHHFFTRRNLWVLASFWEKIQRSNYSNNLQFILTSFLVKTGSKLHNVGIKNGNLNLAGAVPNVLYIPSFIAERNILELFQSKFESLNPIYSYLKFINSYTISTQSSSSNREECSSIFEYIFVDPPFGENIMYSEMNFLWESWLRVFTNNCSEAIINKIQKKGLIEYESLMENCFKEFHNLLKPGRWMTVEFHNSQNSVWNSIQEALLRSGFMIADVRTLDKQQATFKQMTSTGAVKQDLVISAYKPTTDFERKFIIEGGSLNGVWEFVHQHLEKLPMPSLDNGNIEIQGERMPYLLYDRMVAFHLVRGLTVPISASEFYLGLTQRWLMRDGMVFAAAQATTYDQLRLKAERVQQLTLFVTDEASAIQWLMGELNVETGFGPQTYSQIQPKFLMQWHPEKFEKLPELQVILEQSFLRDDKECWYVPDADNAGHLEALRERDLLHEFSQYLAGTGKIKVFRAEAVKAGFSKAWSNHEYNTIIKVAERLPEQALQEDPKLKLYYDNALNRAPKEINQERLI